MKIDDLIDKMEKDLPLTDDLANDSVVTAKIKSRWLDYILKEQIQYKRIKNELAELKAVKFEFYLLEQNHKHDRRDVLEIFIPADKEIQAITNRLSMSERKLELMESVVKSLDQRTFVIKNAIDWQKFQSGI